MKVFYDHYAFSYLKFGGISRYINELLVHIPRENWTTSTLITNNQHLRESKLVNTVDFFPKSSFRGKERLMFNLNLPYTKLKLKTEAFDVFHATWFATPYFGVVKNKPMVVTIHDLIYDVFFTSKDIPHRERIIDMGKKSAQRADKVIAVSQHTKADMIREWGIDENKIEVIYHGVDKTPKMILNQRLIQQPYVFFAGGGRSLNKNFEHLVQAFSILKEKYNDILLVCSGADFTEAEKKLLAFWNVQDNVKHFYASEQQMAQLYHDALMLVVPSYYEGFGFPVLEAMLYDCPVVLSNASCLPEIAGDAGLYFDPYNADEMFERMEMMVKNDDLRKQYASKGQQRIQSFSWDKCAEEHLKVYNSLI